MTIELEESREPTIFNSLLMCFFVGIFLFIALLYRQSELSLLAFLILLVMTATKLWSGMSRYRVAVKINVDRQRVFPDETFTIETMVENAKLLPIRIRIQWWLGSALSRMDGDEQAFRQEAGLLWYQRVQLHSVIVARRRGVYQVGPHCIHSGDLLGFFENEKKPQETTHIIVYPRLAFLKSVNLPMRELFGMPGARSPVKDPVFVLGTRDYQPASPSRHIHWKASARHLKLQEKIFEPSEQGKVLLALEVGSFRENMATDEFESILEVIASLAVQLHGKGCAVGLVTNGVLTGGGPSNLTATRAPGQLPAILEILARLQVTQKGALEPIMHRILGSGRGFSCAYFSYDVGQPAAEIRNDCRRRDIPIGFFICRSQPLSSAIWQERGAKVQTLDEIRIQENRPV
jgi:uncharacterized protein (DUF58 family)